MNKSVNRKFRDIYLLKIPNSMENNYFGCEPLQTDEMQQIQGGAYVANMMVLLKSAYFLTKGFAATVPLAGPLAFGLLTAYADPMVIAA